MRDKIEFPKIKNIIELEEALKYMPKDSYYLFEYKEEKMIIAPYKVYKALIEDNIELLDEDDEY